MQRAFSAFPGGIPGLALAAFRVCVAGHALTNLWPVVAATPWAVSAATLLTLSLVVGLATPVAATIAACAGWIVVVATAADWAACSVWQSAYALVLAFLGPGAFSLDARLYGRREISVTHLDASAPPDDVDEPER